MSSVHNLNFSSKDYTECEFIDSIVNLDISLLNLNIFHVNIRSLNANIDSLIQFLISIPLQFHMVVLSEVWACNIDFYSKVLGNYQFFYDIPIKSKVGGTAVYIHQSLSTFLRPDLRINFSSEYPIEQLWLEIDAKNEKFLIGCLYRHPKCNINHFSYNLNAFLNSPEIDKYKHNILILGDININLLNFDLSSDINAYLDVFLTHGFTPLINSPTRVTANSNTLIDHFLFRNGSTGSTISNISAGNIFTDFTDHFSNFALFHYNTHCLDSTDYKRIFSSKNFINFKNLFSNFDYNFLYLIDDVNASFDYFCAKFQESYDTAFPIISLSKKKQHDQLWLTKDIKNNIDKKNILYKKSINTKLPSDIISYKNCKYNVAKMIKSAKTQYYSRIFDEKLTSMKTIWSQLNKLATITKSDTSLKINYIKVNGIVYTDPLNIANEFVKYFTEIPFNWI